MFTRVGDVVQFRDYKVRPGRPLLVYPPWLAVVVGVSPMVLDFGESFPRPFRSYRVDSPFVAEKADGWTLWPRVAYIRRGEVPLLDLYPDRKLEIVTAWNFSFSEWTRDDPGRFARLSLWLHQQASDPHDPDVARRHYSTQHLYGNFLLLRASNARIFASGGHRELDVTPEPGEGDDDDPEEDVVIRTNVFPAADTLTFSAYLRRTAGSRSLPRPDPDVIREVPAGLEGYLPELDAYRVFTESWTTHGAERVAMASAFGSRVHLLVAHILHQDAGVQSSIPFDQIDPRHFRPQSHPAPLVAAKVVAHLGMRVVMTERPVFATVGTIGGKLFESRADFVAVEEGRYLVGELKTVVGTKRIRKVFGNSGGGGSFDVLPFHQAVLNAWLLGPDTDVAAVVVVYASRLGHIRVYRLAFDRSHPFVRGVWETFLRSLDTYVDREVYITRNVALEGKTEHRGLAAVLRYFSPAGWKEGSDVVDGYSVEVHRWETAEEESESADTIPAGQAEAGGAENRDAEGPVPDAIKSDVDVADERDGAAGDQHSQARDERAARRERERAGQTEADGAESRDTGDQAVEREVDARDGDAKKNVGAGDGTGDPDRQARDERAERRERERAEKEREAIERNRAARKARRKEEEERVSRGRRAALTLTPFRIHTATEPDRNKELRKQLNSSVRAAASDLLLRYPGLKDLGGRLFRRVRRHIEAVFGRPGGRDPPDSAYAYYYRAFQRGVNLAVRARYFSDTMHPLHAEFEHESHRPMWRTGVLEWALEEGLRALSEHICAALV